MIGYKQTWFDLGDVRSKNEDSYSDFFCVALQLGSFDQGPAHPLRLTRWMCNASNSLVRVPYEKKAKKQKRITEQRSGGEKKTDNK